MAKYYGVTSHNAHQVTKNPNTLYRLSNEITVFNTPDAAVQSIQNMPESSGIGQLYVLFEFDGADGLTAPKDGTNHPFTVAIDGIKETAFVLHSGVIHDKQVLGMTKGKPDADSHMFTNLANAIQLREKGLQVFELACKELPEISREALKEWGRLAAQDSEPSASYMYYKVFAESYTFAINKTSLLGMSNSAQQIAKLAMYHAACEAAKHNEENSPYAQHVRQNQEDMRVLHHKVYMQDLDEIAGRVDPAAINDFNVVVLTEGETITPVLSETTSLAQLVEASSQQTPQLSAAGPLALLEVDAPEYEEP